MNKPERRRKDDVNDRLDKLMSDIALLKEKITSDVEYIKATLRSDISQLQNDILYLKTNQHKIEEKHPSRGRREEISGNVARQPQAT